jgi:hypothetical protein
MNNECPLLESAACETAGQGLHAAPLMVAFPNPLRVYYPSPMSLVDDDRAANANQIVQRVQYLWPDSDEREWKFNQDHLRYDVTFLPAPGKHRRIVKIPQEKVDDGNWNWIDKAIASAEEF